MGSNDLTRREMLAAAGTAGIGALALGAQTAEGKSAQAANSKVLQVVFDKQGTIISAAYSGIPALKANKLGTVDSGPMPIKKAGQHAAAIEVPAEYAQLKLADLVQHVRVDVRAGQPKLVKKNK